MFKHEIDRLFTAKVTEYLNKGYWLHTDTMGGSQGEVAKVDLTNGKEVIRVLLDREFSLKGDQLAVKVGRNTDSLRGSTWDTIWNNKLEILETAAFYKIGDNYYVTPEDYEAIYEKHWARRKCAERGHVVELGEVAKEIVLPFVRRQPKCRSMKLRDIERVYKSVSRDDNRPDYYVTAKGRTFRLR